MRLKVTGKHSININDLAEVQIMRGPGQETLVSFEFIDGEKMRLSGADAEQAAESWVKWMDSDDKEDDGIQVQLPKDIMQRIEELHGKG